MEQYRKLSYWLETAGDLTPRPPLDGSIDVDVAILGGGYTGLWTAYELLRTDPVLDVAIVEKEICGFGASGRHGGWCYPIPGVSLTNMIRRFGRHQTLALQAAMFEAVDDIGRVVDDEDIDADFHAGGALILARGVHEEPLLLRRYEDLNNAGFGHDYYLLDRQAVEERIRVAKAVAGIFTPLAATVHAGRLARGLARATERLGGKIYEQTAVTAVHAGTTSKGPRLVTGRGEIRASVVILAAEAYLTRLPRMRRRLLPIYSHIVLTEPLTASELKDIGWAARECTSSMRMSVDYLSQTSDGRVLIGGRGAPYRFGSRIRPRYDQDLRASAHLSRLLVDWFPPLRDVKITHTWGGPVGVSRDWLPTIDFDPAAGVGLAFGYGGNGVATSKMCGRILSELIISGKPTTPNLPILGPRHRTWEMEPFRWLGVRYVQQALERLDRKAAETGLAPDGSSIAERLSNH